jgi:hypothetical protein
VSSTTLAEVRIDVVRERRNRVVRSIGLGVVAVVVVTGVVGGFGVRSRQVSARQGTLEVRVTYPLVARGGLAVPLEVAIERPGGLRGEPRLSISARYLGAFDLNSVSPDPTGSTASAEMMSWTFEPPSDEVLVVRFDVRVEPGVQWRKRGFIEAADAGTVTRVEVDTWIAP